MPRIFSIILLGSFVTGTVFGQGKPGPGLRQQKADVQRRLDEARRSLEDNRERQRQNSEQLASLKHLLDVRQVEARRVSDRVALTGARILHSGDAIKAFEGELDSLRGRYAANIIQVYKQQSNQDMLAFIFSAGSFYEVVQRIRYWHHYRMWQESQAEAMTAREKVLEAKVAALRSEKEREKAQLETETGKIKVLEDEKGRKGGVASRLRGQEARLGREIAAYRQREQRLSRMVEVTVRTSVSSGPRTGSVSVSAGTSGVASSAAGSGNFKGRLGWPVDSRVISMHFGLQSYPGNPGIKIDNLGISVEVNAGADVRCVCEGVVGSVMDMGDGIAVVVRHGKFISIYGNIPEASVKVGDRVREGQVLGHFLHAGSLEFRISDEKGNTYFDPETWLRK